MSNNSVVFKGRKNGINIVLDSSLSFEEIKRQLKLKLVDAEKFFGNTKSAISFIGRDLSEQEEEELLETISKSTQLDIAAPTLEKVFDPFSAKNNMTYFHKGGLRSGQEIRYAGSVVVIGDINPGGEIIAEGNIIVLGTLKGLVHAGCLGNSECYVAALLFRPTQLRIADIISYIPDIPDFSVGKKEIEPSYAYSKEGRIYVEPLTN